MCTAKLKMKKMEIGEMKILRNKHNLLHLYNTSKCLNVRTSNVVITTSYCAKLYAPTFLLDASALVYIYKLGSGIDRIISAHSSILFFIVTINRPSLGILLRFDLLLLFTPESPTP